MSELGMKLRHEAEAAELVIKAREKLLQTIAENESELRDLKYTLKGATRGEDMYSAVCDILKDFDAWQEASRDFLQIVRMVEAEINVPAEDDVEEARRRA